jgi:Tfp pilus assembly protein PilP
LDDLDYVEKWLPDVQVRLQTLKQFVLYAKYLYEYFPVSDEILFNKKMKVTPEIVETHLPKIIAQLEKLEDWNMDNLKQLLINYNKENNLKN